jgi:hypothetical protein
MLADGSITDEDAAAVRQFSEFLQHAGPPARKGEPVEVAPLDRLLFAGRRDLAAYALGVDEDELDAAIDRLMDERRKARVRTVESMTHMVEIACERGCTEHRTKRAIVELFGQTRYGDYPPIPEDLWDVFFIDVFDIEAQGDGDGYCPSADAVSWNLDQFRIWEPVETITLLRCMQELPEAVFVDIGAHIGYYSLLALRRGIPTLAIEADLDISRILIDNMKDYEYGAVREGRVGSGFAFDWSTLSTPGSDHPDLIVKIDVEGAERDAVALLGGPIKAGRVKYALIEISPRFGPGYDALVTRMIDRGYRCFEMPPKADPPHPLDDIRHDLLPFEVRGSVAQINAIVNGWEQRNVLFVHNSMDWPME